MIQIIDMKRGSGKTTLAKQLVEQDSKSIMLVPNFTFKKIYGLKYWDKIFTFDEFLNNEETIRGLQFDKIIIDEAFGGRKDELAKLYYRLGRMNIDVMAIGTAD